MLPAGSHTEAAAVGSHIAAAVWLAAAAAAELDRIRTSYDADRKSRPGCFIFREERGKKKGKKKRKRKEEERGKREGKRRKM